MWAEPAADDLPAIPGFIVVFDVISDLERTFGYKELRCIGASALLLTVPTVTVRRQYRLPCTFIADSATQTSTSKNSCHRIPPFPVDQYLTVSVCQLGWCSRYGG